MRYVYFDYAGNLDKRRSTTGYILTLFKAPVSWRSTWLSTVTLSTMKVEYLAMTEAMKETIWLQALLDDLEIDQDLLKTNYDNKSAIYLAKKQVYHVRTKNIDVRFHFVREILDKDDIELQRIHTRENPADMLTKIVPRVKFAYCRELLHIVQVAWARWSSFGWTTNGLIPSAWGM